ncbi:MAG TPA: peptidase M48, partial [Desulfobacteraceae bacterium]|nr:peptidase M48 [Desulfobacteraceae bacterium]
MNKGLIATMMICLMLSGCAQMDSITKVAASVAASTGVITQSQADSISKTSGAIAKSAEDITPEQEYYIGRTIGAVIIGKYPPYQNQKVNRYLNLLGQTLAQASDRPETFGGYHFLVLDSDEINAFAA